MDEKKIKKDEDSKVKLEKNEKDEKNKEDERRKKRLIVVIVVLVTLVIIILLSLFFIIAGANHNSDMVDSNANENDGVSASEEHKNEDSKENNQNEVERYLKTIKEKIEESSNFDDGEIVEDATNRGWMVFHKIGESAILFPLEKSVMLSYDSLYSFSDRKTDEKAVNNLISRATDTLNEMGFIEYAERDAEGPSRWKYYRNEVGVICGFNMNYENSVVRNASNSWSIVCASESWNNKDNEELAVELADVYSRRYEDEPAQITSIFSSDNIAYFYVLGRSYHFYKDSMTNEWMYAFESGDGVGPICSTFSDEGKEFFQAEWLQCMQR